MKTAAIFLAVSTCAGLLSAQSYELTSDSPAANTIHFFPSGAPAPGAIVIPKVAPNFAVTTSNLVQGSGPVMRNPINYLIFWQPPGRAAFPAGYQTAMENFFQNVGGTPFYNIVTQYNDKSGNPVPNSTSWGGSWVDTTNTGASGCNGTATGAVGATPNCPLSDSDIQSEVNKAIAANPAWSTSATNVEYFVFTPSNVGECAGTDKDGNASCFDINGGVGPKENADFCAYHSFFGGSKIYAFIPFGSNGSCYPSFSTPFPNGAAVDIALSAVSHEMIESNTDPHIDGWKGPGGNDDEIGDKCAYKYGFVAPDGTNTVLNGNRYLIQTEWSNSVTGCAKRFGNTPTLSIPATVSFGGVPTGTSASRNLNIANSGTGDADILYIRLGAATDPGFSLSNVPPTWATLHNGNNLAVNVLFSSTPPPRNATGSVIVDTDQTPCDSGDSCQTSSSETINPLAAAALIPPTIGKSFGVASIPLGTNANLSFTIGNPDTVSLSGVGFTDTLPAGLIVASAAGAACGGGTITATVGSGSIILTGATLAGGASCTFTIVVTGTSAGIQNNVTGAITSNEAGSGNTAKASIQVIAPPVITKTFVRPKIIPGGATTLSLSILNPNSFAALTGVAFTDALPGTIVVNTPNALASTCGGTATAAPGSNTVSLTGGTIAASAVCTVTVSVKGPAEGIFVNSVPVTSTNGGAGNTSSATLFVATPPNLSKTFGEVSIGVGNTTSLTLTLSNPNHIVTLNALQFSDTLPAGLVVAAPNGLTGSCGGGTITAVAGGSLITLGSAALAPQASCTFSVNVTSNGSALGYVTNTTSTVTSTEALDGAAASAILFIGNPFQVSYAANLSSGDSVTNISNAGTLGAALPSGTTAAVTGALCANVYAFTPDEQLVSCCSCPVTPNGLVSLSAKSDLATNTLTPAVPTALVIKLIATVPVAGSCTNSAASVGTATLANGMVSFATTIHATPAPATFGVTEFPNSASTLSAGELSRIGQLCNFILANGSGFGVCRSCRIGGLGTDRQ